MARKTLTDTGVAALKPRDKTYAHPDPQCPGHYVRVTPTGSKRFVAVTRDKNGKQKWFTLGNAAHLNVEDARTKAIQIIVRVKGGEDPSGPATFDSVVKEWIKRHVQAKGILSTEQLNSYLDRFLLPAWGGRNFESIKRSDITALMDTIEDKAGPVAADRALGWCSNIFTWYAARNDNYSSPIIRGMKRTSQKDRARDRILSDDEIRMVWDAAKGQGAFGDIVRIALLTAQRREKLVSMRWDDISADGTWHIQNGNTRRKGTGGDLVLPAMALDIIGARPRLASNPFVFPGIGQSHFKSYARAKRAIDKATGELPQWQLHDLRRTARTLMERAGVRPDIAERVLGHVQQGVQGVYNRHRYRDEKAQALKMLAGLVENILRGDSDKKIARLRG
jgi:integrase